jgi:hypothetical protein
MFGLFTNSNYNLPKKPVSNNNSHAHNHNHENIPGIERTYMANIIGPGYWSALHKLSAEANTEEGKKFFLYYLKFIRNHFPCIECKTHINEYINANPIEPYLKQEDGCFFWVWKFHNTVNRRLKKKEITLEEATKIYKKEHGVCSLNCASNSPTQDDNIKNSIQIKPTVMNNNNNYTKYNSVINDDSEKAKNFDQALGYVVRHNFRG